jgi:hypothetical protein
MRTLERVGLALALVGLLVLPGCYEVDQVFPWNWHVPKKIKPYERLPGKTDVEKKKHDELDEERRGQETMPTSRGQSGSSDELDREQEQ